MFTRRLLVTAIGLASTANVVAEIKAAENNLPEVKVEEAQWPLQVNHTLDGNQLSAPDAAAALKQLPGASVTRNGSLSGIAQYRGLQGDQVNVSIDSASIVTGGPNAMDAPLSYIPASLLNEIKVSRGAASVSQGQETFGGHIEASSYKGEFGSGDAFEVSGRAHSNYTSQNKGSSSSVLVTVANDTHKLTATTSYDNADDSEFDGGDIDSTEYERRRHDLFYGYQNGDTRINLKAGKNNTGLSGTPALAMDISSIDSDLLSGDITTKIGDVKVTWSSSYSHVNHDMNNYELRPSPGMMGERLTQAKGQQVSHKLMFTIPVSNGEVRTGADYSASIHNADVVNPNSALFITNFNDSERDILGAFAELTQQSGAWSWEIGARLNRVEMDADTVSATGMPMMMMQNNADTLSDAFNAADRSETYNNRDLVFKTAYQLSDELTLNASLSSKERAPSYQQRYLWLPMAATGGLADGRNYIGNLDLDSETANEVNLGFDYKANSSYVSLQAFYRKVDDYIQGTTTTNMAANMVANMMSGNTALQFNNVDAKLYGAELTYGTQLNDNWSIDGSLSYTRGKRTDESDDLYRLAPLNNRLSLTYNSNNWKVSAVSEIFDAQNHVAEFNEEQKSSGYGLLHLQGQIDINEQLQLRAGIDNLTDKKYQDHLAGVNRVSGNDDIAVGERLYGTGRSVNVGVTYSF
ncbi:TonB-dependent receptor [Maricurvus nonylphenolicus]|uniref:TonB-dependent receptor plug domain-containing protein n=1 Tax=Maricurvus nonylphenolicus TaxID=1008307 RepID=UPI0036F32591